MILANWSLERKQNTRSPILLLLFRTVLIPTQVNEMDPKDQSPQDTETGKEKEDVLIFKGSVGGLGAI